MPNAMFTAVPRSPPAQQLIRAMSMSSPAVDSAVVRSSSFAQLFATPDVEDENFESFKRRRRSSEGSVLKHASTARRHLSFREPGVDEPDSEDDSESLDDFNDDQLNRSQRRR